MRGEPERRSRDPVVALTAAAVLLVGVAAGGLAIATRGFAVAPTPLDTAWAALVAPVAPALEPVALVLNAIGRRPLSVIVPLVIATAARRAARWR